MDDHMFEDVLAGSAVTLGFPSLSTQVKPTESVQQCTSLFFPGCSFLNYAPDLVSKTYELLKSQGKVDGMSVLCCGKILSFEEQSATIKPSFQKELIESLVDAGVERIVTACPNCMEELRVLLDDEGLSEAVEVIPLPSALLACGCSLPADRISSFVQGRVVGGSSHEEGTVPAGAPMYLQQNASGEEGRHFVAIHDSCPDRKTGEFAGGIRELVDETIISELAHNRRLSICCGSLANAAGKPDAARKIAENRGIEARKAHASALMVYCMSCAYMLASRQSEVPVFHYLEALFDTRIDWDAMPPYMGVRFLFEELKGTRSFAGGRA